MIRDDILPSCFFPTTTVVVDDSRSYLENLRIGLMSETILNLIDSPVTAIDFLRRHCVSEDALTAKCMKKSDAIFDYSTSGHMLHLNLEAIYQAVYNPARFNEISLVIVDYSMPQMTGIELLHEIKDLPCKKVMLTGEADQVIAVSAFNAGIIDKFILKGDADAMGLVDKAIEELQLSYFQEASQGILDSLKASGDCCLNDSHFVQFFKQLCIDHDIVEYYLTQAPGSFFAR